MPQRQKEEVRNAIVQAAAEVFAQHGFDGATLAGIAARAHTSVGNVYKYFDGKQSLLSAAVPAGFIAELERRLDERVAALGVEHDVLVLPPDHAYHQASDALLTFAFSHRARLLFLLSRAAGTPHAPFRDKLLRQLVGWALRYAKQAYPTLPWTRARKRALTRIYEAFLTQLAGMLSDERSKSALGEAIRSFTTYHLAGLRALFTSYAPTPPSPSKDRR